MSCKQSHNEIFFRVVWNKYQMLKELLTHCANFISSSFRALPERWILISSNLYWMQRTIEAINKLIIKTQWPTFYVMRHDHIKELFYILNKFFLSYHISICSIMKSMEFNLGYIFNMLGTLRRLINWNLSFTLQLKYSLESSVIQCFNITVGNPQSILLPTINYTFSGSTDNLLISYYIVIQGNAKHNHIANFINIVCTNFIHITD